MEGLSVAGWRPIWIRPFVSPVPGHVPGTTDLSRAMTLGPAKRQRRGYSRAGPVTCKSPDMEPTEAPPPVPLILWEADENSPPDSKNVEVDDMLTRWLREHQRQGVSFIFDCLMGQRDFAGEGCILADDMGLGKTLQSIAVMWTLLNSNIDGKPPAVRRAVIICPASLVKNWASEIQKWLCGRCVCTAVAEAQKDKVVAAFAGFAYDRRSKVLIASYETFRLHCGILDGFPIDMIICDEAHRLKNDRTKTAQSIMALPARKRLLLSGTPIQNDLDEFYSLVSLCNPAVLGTAAVFRKRFAGPIIRGRDPSATKREVEIGSSRLLELSQITNLFILRRSNALLAKVLPPKLTLCVFCPLTAGQRDIYKALLRSKTAEVEQCKTGVVLGLIQSMMKLCNHPALLKSSGLKPDVAAKVAGYLNQDSAETQGKRMRGDAVNPALSGKFSLLTNLLRAIRDIKDRVVIISNFTQTLDIIGNYCRLQGYPAVRLDGSVGIKRRHDLVTKFNDPLSLSFVFLLSSKAGGCGINLIGANRLVMFDPDWNPANDKQALARIWRDGQRKTCYVYRLFATGTIEERVLQRQMNKSGLGQMLVTEVGHEAGLKDSLSAEALRELFTLQDDAVSTTHEALKCTRCTENYCDQMPHGAFDEEDLSAWSHHWEPSTVEDSCLRQAATNEGNSELPSSLCSFCITSKIEFVETTEP